MGVYVDRLQPSVPSKTWRWTKSAHLIADTLEELHEFAERIGLRRAWFQQGSTPHYDLTETRYAKALALGVTVLERKDFVAVIRRLRAERVAKEGTGA
jgi:hypothetical protein